MQLALETHMNLRTVDRQAMVRILLERLAPQVGLEPTTLRLTAECSAIELLRNIGVL